MPNWTDEQRAAIESRGENLLLAAAAGSGKTTVMVERILSLIREGAGVESMLVVTFTRASAADMRAKLTEKLTALADKDQHCRDQLAVLESASISTIHSFCTSLLRTYFESAGVDPAFRVLDDTENAELLDNAAEEAMESAYAAMTPDLQILNEGRGPDTVRLMADDLYKALQDRPDPEAWLASVLENMSGDGSVWFEELAKEARLKIREAIATAEYYIDLAENHPCLANHAEAMRADKALMETYMSMSYDELQAALPMFKSQATSRKGVKKNSRSPEEQELCDRATDAKGDYKKSLTAALRQVRYDRETAMRDIRDDVASIRALIAIVQDMAERHEQAKAARCGLTFNDLEHRSLELMRQPDIREAVRARYEYVFVDEYQDTSDVQEELISLVARDDRRFMVGDVKQSIYRFRQAEPSLFLHCYSEYDQGNGGRLLALTKNFRSRGAVLAFTNRVFERAMCGGDSEIVYEERARLNRGAGFEGIDPPVEIDLILKPESGHSEPEDSEDETEDLTMYEREAALVVERIRSLRQENPSLRYRDIAVLSRTGKNVLNTMLMALLDAGIPAYADTSAGYFEVLEVRVFLAYLTLVENSRRDEAMITVLRSPMVHMASADLALIRAESREGLFSDAVKAYAKNDNTLGRRLKAFLTDIENDRVLSRSMPLPRLFQQIWNRTGFADALLSLPGGTQRKANLERLAAKAAMYEENQSGGLTGFLRYAARMHARGEESTAHIVGEADDVVRLMTVHKSKGLEFPVVIGVAMGRKIRVRKSSAPIELQRDLGAGLEHIDRVLLTRRDTVARMAIGRRKATEERAEELRILYVLLTRAKERLILVGTTSDEKKQISTWCMMRRNPFIYTNYLDVLMPPLFAELAAEHRLSSEGDGIIEDGDLRVSVRWIYGGTLHAANLQNDDRRGSIRERLLQAAEGNAEAAADTGLHEAMAWRYPNERETKQPIKLTASGLQRELEGPEVIPELIERPQFLSEGGMTGAERGTAIHTVMQNLAYGPLREVCPVQLTLDGYPKPETRRDAIRLLQMAVQAQVDTMFANGILTEAMYSVVPCGMIARFFSGEIGRRILSAETLHREWPFNLRMRAEDALTETDRARYSGAMILVQGTIDLCFIENGAWVLVDYKTDRSTDVEELTAHYGKQLGVYAAALERITGIPVRQKLLCLLRHNNVIELP